MVKNIRAQVRERFVSGVVFFGAIAKVLDRNNNSA